MGSMPGPRGPGIKGQGSMPRFLRGPCQGSMPGAHGPGVHARGPCQVHARASDFLQMFSGLTEGSFLQVFPDSLPVPGHIHTKAAGMHAIDVFAPLAFKSKDSSVGSEAHVLEDPAGSLSQLTFVPVSLGQMPLPLSNGPLALSFSAVHIDPASNFRGESPKKLCLQKCQTRPGPRPRYPTA